MHKEYNAAQHIASLGAECEQLLQELAAFSSLEGGLTRLFLSDEHAQAAGFVAALMQDCGLQVKQDTYGTICGHLAGAASLPTSERPVLLIGSHIDTVRNAGVYDGTLGVVAGALALRELQRRGLVFAADIDLLAFGDEEGVRFPTTLLSSAAIAGYHSEEQLRQAEELCDGEGVRLGDALGRFNSGVAHGAIGYNGRDVLGYLEAHIEQGPVLEAQGRALGAVSAIAGASRFHIDVSGMAGHAGTVPMSLRRDAVCAAAELTLAVESIARKHSNDGLVATIGEVTVRPGAVNVIAAGVQLSLDVRAPADALRLQAEHEIMVAAQQIAKARACEICFDKYHECKSIPCDTRLQNALENTLAALGCGGAPILSGAGHDGQAMQALCPIAMLFVRCEKGISHNPSEATLPDDLGLCVLAMANWIEDILFREGFVNGRRD
ncbi:M20 family metallo-hydrolase [Polycladidibacter hongkongensis]|uniref:M20 family metallo-hydrolase n=1 Tax=Polycladidibacter hongkongensis TaxID=1647556 RepID=UPI00082D4314|nr:M20 family metallo-hydrolase [Pseudovibrio hongkongensis]